MGRELARKDADRVRGVSRNGSCWRIPIRPPERLDDVLRAYFCVRREKASIFSGCKSHPATQSLQPVAIGAAVEVTKPPKPSMQRVALGDFASRQAVT